LQTAVQEARVMTSSLSGLDTRYPSSCRRWLISPPKSAAGHIIRMRRQPRYQQKLITASKYLHLIYKLTLETSVLIFNCVNVKYTHFVITETARRTKFEGPLTFVEFRRFKLFPICVYTKLEFVRF
jgi:hypothetical protein